MTINSQTPTEVQSPGNGSATVFSVPIKIFAATDLVVGFIVGGQYSAVTTGFTVSDIDVNGGCTVTFTTAPGATTTVDFRTVTPITQPTEFANLGRYLPENVTDALDRTVRSVQDVYRQTYTFGIHGPDTESVVWPALPGATGRANTALLFDSSGLPSVGVLLSSVFTQSNFNAFVPGSWSAVGSTVQSSAEIAAGVTPSNYQYTPLDMRRYGADATGVAPSDSALAQAIAVCGTAGGIIRFGAGTYSFANTVNLAAKTGITFQGNSGTSGGGGTATVLNYTGAASPFINWDSAVGCQLKGLQIVPTNVAFSGQTLVRQNNDGTHGDPSYNVIEDCTIGGNAAPCILFDINKSINFTIERTNMIYGNPAIRGAQAGGYSNSITIRDCEFHTCTTAPIQDGGQAWLVENCTFEPLVNGAPGAILSTASGRQFVGLAVNACWFGDATTAPGTWIDIYGGSLNITANYISGNATGSTAIILRTFNGAVILGNSLTSFLVGFSFQGACGQVVLKGNVLNGVTTPVSGGNNVSTGTFDWGANFGVGVPGSNHGAIAVNGYIVQSDGVVRMWGTATGLVSGNNTVTFPLAGGFPTACLNVVATLSGVNATTDRSYVGTLSAASFVLNVQTAGTDTATWQAIGY